MQGSVGLQDFFPAGILRAHNRLLCTVYKPKDADGEMKNTPYMISNIFQISLTVDSLEEGVRGVKKELIAGLELV